MGKPPFLICKNILGENIEPSELEEAAMRSTLIHQIVVIGQVKFRHNVKGLSDSMIFAKIILS